ncbi:MAG: protein kinase [Eubacteriales bacterium]|nr:protein kinase [Eubacteriales bacterium]
MTIQEEYELSCYQYITNLKGSKNVTLVKNTMTDEIFVKKVLTNFNEDIYKRLMEYNFPGIPKIELCIRDDDKLILIEEYIHGETLEKRLSRRLFTENETVSLILSLCNILMKLHFLTPPIIHRDIKPTNIIISSDNIVRLIDYNAARHTNKNSNKDTMFMGTEAFAAPEQFGFGQSDARTDIYALGVLANYCLTGKSSKDYLYNDGPMSDIIKKCTKLNPEERYSNVNELINSLRLINPDAFSSQGIGSSQDIGSKKSASINMTDSLSCDNIRISWRQYLPVGFRSGKLLNIVVSILGYAFLILLCSSMVFTSGENNDIPVTGVILYITRILVFLMFFVAILMAGNYLNILNNLPFYGKHKILDFLIRTVACILGFIIVFLLSCFVLAMIQ